MGVVTRDSSWVGGVQMPQKFDDLDDVTATLRAMLQAVDAIGRQQAGQVISVALLANAATLAETPFYDVREPLNVESVSLISSTALAAPSVAVTLRKRGDGSTVASVDTGAASGGALGAFVPYKLSVQTTRLERDDVLTIQIAPSGGFAGTFTGCLVVRAMRAPPEAKR